MYIVYLYWNGSIELKRWLSRRERSITLIKLMPRAPAPGVIIPEIVTSWAIMQAADMLEAVMI